MSYLAFIEFPCNARDGRMHPSTHSIGHFPTYHNAKHAAKRYHTEQCRMMGQASEPLHWEKRHNAHWAHLHTARTDYGTIHVMPDVQFHACDTQAAYDATVTYLHLHERAAFFYAKALHDPRHIHILEIDSRTQETYTQGIRTTAQSLLAYQRLILQTHTGIITVIAPKKELPALRRAAQHPDWKRPFLSLPLS